MADPAAIAQRTVVRDRLTRAARDHEPILIAYHGGSQPGTVRHLVPISVGRDYMDAEDVASGCEKTYRIARVEFPPDSGYLSLRYEPEGVNNAARSIGEHFHDVRDKLEATGWHVTLVDDAIELRAFFKNGNMRKTAALALHYSEFSVALVDDFDGRGEYEEKRLSKRPYSLWGKRLPTARTYSKLSSATAVFMEEARCLAPSRAGQGGTP